MTIFATAWLTKRATWTPSGSLVLLAELPKSREGLVASVGSGSDSVPLNDSARRAGTVKPSARASGYDLRRGGAF
jgi:hypothetical protein